MMHFIFSDDYHNLYSDKMGFTNKMTYSRHPSLLNVLWENKRRSIIVFKLSHILFLYTKSFPWYFPKRLGINAWSLTDSHACGQTYLFGLGHICNDPIRQYQKNEILIPILVWSSKACYMVHNWSKVGGSIELHTIQAVIVGLENSCVHTKNFVHWGRKLHTNELKKN